MFTYSSIANIFNIRTISKMLLIFFVNISLSNFVIAGPVNWEEVNQTSEGRQWVDLGSIRMNKKGDFEALTRFRSTPRSEGATEETNLYLMQINCKEALFRDTYVNGLPRINAKWKSPNGDQLILNVLDKVCSTEVT